MAEGSGFEPLVAFKGHGRLANAWFKPLTQPSVIYTMVQVCLYKIFLTVFLATPYFFASRDMGFFHGLYSRLIRLTFSSVSFADGAFAP